MKCAIFSGGGKKASDGKGREGKGSHASFVTYEEAAEILDVDAYWVLLDQCVSDMKEHFIKHLTLRSAKSNFNAFHPNMSHFKNG